MKNTNTRFNSKVITSGLLFLLASVIFTKMAFAQGGGGTPPPTPNSSFSTQTLCGKVRVIANGPSYPGETNGDWYVHINGGEIDGVKLNYSNGSWYADVTSNSGSLFYVSASTGPNAWSSGVYLGALSFSSDLPILHDLNDPGTKCAGSSVAFRMDNSQTNVTYHLKKDGATVTSKAGTGGSFPFSSVSAAGTYTVTAIHDVSKCSRTMNNSWTLHNKPAAPSYTISSNNCGNKTITPGTPPVGITWARSNFTLVSVPDQAPDKDNLEGPNGDYYSYTPFDATVETGITTTLNFRAMNAVTGCMSSLETETITVKPYPQIYDLNEPSATCSGQPIQFKLSGSENGVTYHLQRGGHTVASKSGSGGMITFSEVTSAGSYSAIAIHDANGCQKPMNETRDIDGLPDPPSHWVSANDCSDKTFARSGTPPAGITCSLSKFELINVEAGPPKKEDLEAHVDDYYEYDEFSEDLVLTASRSFELQSLNEVTGCLSAVVPVTVEVFHIPDVLDRIENHTFCGIDATTGDLELTGLQNDVVYSIEGDRVGENLGSGKVKWADLPQGRYTVYGSRGTCGRYLNAIIYFDPKEMPTVSNDTLEVFAGTVLDLQVLSGSDKGTWSGPGVNRHNMVAARAGIGIHQVDIYYDNGGCILDDSISVNVNPIPTLKLNDFAVIRSGHSVGMTIENYSADHGYGWHKGNADVSGSAITADQAGLYVLKSTTSSGYSALSNSIYLTEAKQPVDLNYVASNTYRNPEKIEANLPTVYSETSRGIQYIDGLGQVSQVVQKNATPNANDLTATSQLDEYGRTIKEYLPLPKGNAGDYQAYYGEDQLAFYTSAHGASEGQAAYSETVYEGSPLSRPKRTHAPGAVWNKDQGNRPVEMVYGFNGNGEVIDWSVENDQPKRNAAYEVGKLFKTTTINENGRQVQEFKNLQGQVVLKKVQASETAPVSNEDWYQTYYVYDDLGNLRFVIPPKATQFINN